MRPSITVAAFLLAVGIAAPTRPAAALGPPAEDNLAVVSIDMPSTPYMPPLVPFAPTATIRNAGANPEDGFAVFFVILDSLGTVAYQDSIIVPDTLLVDSLRQTLFAPFTPQPGMSYLAKAYTALAIDGYPYDDTLTRPFSCIQYHDLAVTAIDTPAAFVLQPGIPFAPSCMVRNGGTYPESGFRVWFTISDSLDLQVYADSQTVPALAVQSDTQLLFAPFMPDSMMRYLARAYTALAGDTFPANDTARLEFRTFEYAGAVSGQVFDANAANAPLADAVLAAVSADGAWYDTTDALGGYSFSSLPVGSYALTASKPGYVDSTVSGVAVSAGSNLSLDFALGYPVMALTPSDSVSIMLSPGSADSSRWLVLRNTGTRGAVCEITWPARAAKAFPDSVWGLDIEATTSDNVCLGVEFDGGNFWVTGAAGSPSADPNYLYQLDRSGNLLASIPQPAGNGWGWRDLCWDGQYLYGASDSVIMQIDPADGDTTGIRITSPCAVARGLAYDPASDHFFVADFGDSIYQITRGGAVLHAWANDRNIFGLAWDATAPDGPWLWALSDSDEYFATSTAVKASQFDPRNGVYTGLQFSPHTADSANAAAGGLAFSASLIPGRGTLVALVQDDRDRLVAYDIRPENARWLSLSGTSLALAPSQRDSVRLTFSNVGLDSLKNYSAWIKVAASAPAHVDSILALLRSPYGITGVPARAGPTPFALLTCRPNPLFTRTAISFALPTSQSVELIVYNVAGQRVRTLCSSQLPIGWHTVLWDGKDERGGRVASGIYVYRLRAGSWQGVKKMTVVR